MEHLLETSATSGYLPGVLVGLTEEYLSPAERWYFNIKNDEDITEIPRGTLVDYLNELAKNAQPIDPIIAIFDNYFPLHDLYYFTGLYDKQNLMNYLIDHWRWSTPENQNYLLYGAAGAGNTTLAL